MPVFQIPKEYFGVSGLAQGIGQGLQGREVMKDKRRTREREDFVFEEEKKNVIRRQEGDIIARSGRGSKDHLAFLAANGLPTDSVLLDPEVKKQSRIRELSTIPDENLTTAQRAELNILEGKPILGYESAVELATIGVNNAKTEAAINTLALNEANFTAEQKKRLRDTLETKYGMTQEMIDARILIAGVRAAEKNLEVIDANIRQSNAAANANNAQAESYRSQANGGGMGYDISSLRTLAGQLNQKGVRIDGRPLSPAQVNAGLSGQLPAAAQRQFDQASIAVSLAPRAAEVSESIRSLRSQVGDLEEEIRKEERREDTDKDLIDDLRSQQQALRDQVTATANAWEVTKKNAYDSGGINTAQIIAGRPSQGGGTIASGGGALAATATAPSQDEIKTVRALYPSLAAIEADPDADDEMKKLLRDTWIAGEAAATKAVTPTPAAAQTPQRPRVTAPSRESSISTAQRTAAQRDKTRVEAEIARITKSINDLGNPQKKTPSIPQADWNKIVAWRDELEKKEDRLKDINRILR